MKITFSYRLYLTLLLAALSFNGCNEKYKSTTKINSDGSCEKLIMVNADSSFIRNGYFHIPSDSSWHPEFKTMDKDTQKVFVAKKSFADVNLINDEYKNRKKAGVEISFEKKFRWFFTYYTYTETYKAYNPFNTITLDSFLTKKEYSQYVKGDTSKALKKRLDEFFTEDVFEYFYRRVRSAVENLKDNSFTVSMLDSKKKEIRDKLIAKSSDDDKIAQYIEEIVKSKSALRLESDLKNIMRDINDKLKATDVRYEFTNEIIMPGIILNTNANSIEGNKVAWNFPSDKFMYLNYSMMVESRSSNLWTVYITGGIVLVIIILLLIPKFRKNRL